MRGRTPIAVNLGQKWSNLFVAGLILLAALSGQAQGLPSTAGETLSGKRIELSDAIRGHAVVLIACFSREAGDGCGAWAKAVRSDPALAGIAVYQVAMLERAPGFMRGMIKSGMRKGISAAEQDNFLVLTQDDKLWRSYFSVTADKDPYVVLLNASGQICWHGHGAAKDLEPLLRTARP
ncbi:hypothetical protein [Acidicapsa acidisoli]|uniref:hypothetical protein n=1 Tax=Acidicapsa acidisoli TaxID=1615681 RepID=UPI0021E01142|nr:hypothetical protein [Acidicapsa acidisoli]